MVEQTHDEHTSQEDVEMTESDEATPPIVLVVMGVSGTGKSTVAGMLAGRLGWDLEEGDDLHPAANVAKMASGQPLTDEDRWPWLDKISAWIQVHVGSGTPGIVTCSSLRKAYRDKLRGPGVAFVHLHGSKEMIAERLNARLDHFMPSTLLDSQLATLEPLDPDEVGIVVPLGQKPKDEVKEIMRRLHLSQLPPPVLNEQGLIAE
ncbi:gluconokinase [Microlunatus phosphovorus NM-1]|uniref:Gluconokinase n=2 Tax=Microlunatus phosphovorus TaxID=29405 RepID=F5XPP1_MICPN|nr:gluconokinase [Microlunatus phosphovorus NM-1]